MAAYFWSLGRITKSLSAFVVVFAVFSGAMSCSPNDPRKAETIKVATLALETSTPIFIAEAQDLFTRNGLIINARYYDTGLGTLNGVLSGEADIAVPVGEYALVGKIFDNAEIQTIGTVDKVEYQAVVGRKDRGIEDISSLKGKRLGVIQRTQQEFYLTRFLELNGIKVDDVTIVNVTLAQSVNAIANGDVDAVMLVPPYISAAQQKLGSKAVLWPAQSNQLTHQLMICRKEWIKRHPKLVERFLKSMAEAQDYLVRSPEEAKKLIKMRLNLKEEDIARIWSQNQFALSLDQSLVAAMEDEARWMITKDLTSEKSVPDFLKYIYMDGLKAVEPEAVRIMK
jgi:NitT/TauT family transport system substrate-binding protein